MLSRGGCEKEELMKWSWKCADGLKDLLLLDTLASTKRIAEKRMLRPRRSCITLLQLRSFPTLRPRIVASNLCHNSLRQDGLHRFIRLEGS